MKINPIFPEFPINIDGFQTRKQEIQIKEAAKKDSDASKVDLHDYDLGLTVREGKLTPHQVDTGDTCRGTYGDSCGGGSCACSVTCTCVGTYECPGK